MKHKKQDLQVVVEIHSKNYEYTFENIFYFNAVEDARDAFINLCDFYGADPHYIVKKKGF